jgi:hypothetical protein
VESGASPAASAGRSARLGALIAGAGGLVLIASLFVPWYTLPGSGLADGPLGDLAEDVGGAVGIDVRDAVSRTGWEAFEILDVFAVAAGLVALARALMVQFGDDPDPALPGSLLTLVLGGVALAMIAYRVFNPPGIGMEREVGLWLGMFAAGTIVYGSYVSRGHL